MSTARIFSTIVSTTLAAALCTTKLTAADAPSTQTSTDYHLAQGQSPTALTVHNASKGAVYANLVLGQPPSSPPANCTSLGTQIESINDSKLNFSSSVSGKSVSFTGPSGVTTKGAYLMDAGETITYNPQTFSCFQKQKCTPALTANFFFTEGFNGTTEGNNGCGGTGTTYPNATNLAEASLNFGANGATGSTCANADDTDISAVNGVNAVLSINTTDAGSGQAWPSATSIAKNKALGENTNRPGVFGWAATNCTNPSGYPNPTSQCAGPVDAPAASNGACTAPNTLITGPGGSQFCAQTSSSGTCNNQRAAFNTGGTIKITYHHQIAPKTTTP